MMVEKTRREGEQVWIEDSPGERQNICAKGEDLSVGKVVLEPGRSLRPVDLSVLAAVGCDPVPVFRRPRVSILTTGDELVAPGEVPGPGQIREGNTLHLAAMASAAGAEVRAVGLVVDEQVAGETRDTLSPGQGAIGIQVYTGHHVVGVRALPHAQHGRSGEPGALIDDVIEMRGRHHLDLRRAVDVAALR